MLRRFAPALATLAVLGTLAHADADLIRRDVSVSYSDLNISSEQGARALLARIDVAAKEACGVSATFYSVYSTAPGLAQKQFAACHSDAVSRAVSSLNAPLVTQAYARAGDFQRVAGR